MNWPNDQATAKFSWLHIQCYDDNDRPVARFGNMQVPTAIMTSTTASGAGTKASAPTGLAAPPTSSDNKSTGNQDPLSGAGRDVVVGAGVVGAVVAAVVAAVGGL